MIMLRLLQFVVMVGALTTAGGANTFNPIDYGATGDGKTDDTRAVRAAAAACAAAGGGTLFFPSLYTFLTGPFNLTSNTVLFVAPQGMILGSTNVADYPLIEPLPWFGPPLDWHPLIHSDGASNVTITGEPIALETMCQQGLKALYRRRDH
jgi:polygalacturonase